MSTREDRTKLYELIDDIKIAMLTTIERNGSLHTRPMANQKADKQGTLWFLTEKDGGVAANIRANSKLSLGYASPGAYVAVTGNGKVVDDRAKIAELWTEAATAWFPKGKDDPNIVVLKVDPNTGEYWSFPSAPISVAIGYVKAKLTGEPADDVGENRKVAL